MADTYERVALILVEQLDITIADAKPDAVILADQHQPHLDADSLDVIEILMRCEEEFRIEIADHQNFATVQDLVNLCDELKSR